MADLFISYARADRSRVAPLVTALEAEGFSVWWDPEIIPGQEFDRLIADELDKAWAVVVVWTPTSVESVWVRGEAREGRERGVLAPARFDNARLPIDMRAIHATDLDGWNADRNHREFRQLVRAIRALEPGRAKSSPQHGVAQDAGAATRRRPPRVTRPRIVWAVAAALVIAAGGTFLLLRPRAPQGPPSIAVMPFHTASGDTLERGFAQGVTAQVADGLTKADLKVVTQEEGQPAETEGRPADAAKLGARFAVDGVTTRSADHRLMVDAHLDDVRDGQVLWSAHFDRPDKESQAMQEQVADKIADVAQCALNLHGFNGGSADDETARLYLKVCDLWDEPEGKSQLRSLLTQIIDREPGLAKAWSTLALLDAQSATADAAPSPVVAEEARRNAEEEVRRAQALDPKDPRIYSALYVLQAPSGKWRERDAILAKGLSFAPDAPELLTSRAELLLQTGRVDEAADNARRAMELDPLSPEVTTSAFMYLAYGDVPNNRIALADARTVADHAIRIWPGNPDVWWGRMAITARAGDPADALKIIDGDPPAPPGAPTPALKHWRETVVVRASHDPERTRAYVDQIASRVTGHPYYRNLVLLDVLTVGATDAAYALISKDPDPRDIDTTILFRPYAEGMRQDPRFMALAARLGLVDYWRATNHWPDFCAPPQKTYDCKAAIAALGGPIQNANVAAVKPRIH